MTMKKNLILAAALLIALAACGPKNAKEWTVRTDEAAPADIETVAVSWEILPIDEREMPIPTPFRAKCYGSKTFLQAGHYPSGVKVYMLEEGRVAGVLDAQGRGPGEYQDLSGFACCPETSELLINDRILKGFRHFRVPEMTWESDEPLGRYLLNFEVLDATHSVFCYEPEGETPGRLVIWDHARGEAVSSMEVSMLEGSLMEEMHQTRTARGAVLFSIPGRTTTLWRADVSGFSPVAEVALLPDAFGPEVWEEQNRERLVQRFSEVMEKDPRVAIGADFPVLSGKSMAFWYHAGYASDPMWRLAISRPDGVRTVSKLTVEGYPDPLQVIGSDGDRWISVLELELLEDVPAPKGRLYTRLQELKAQGCETVLLFFSVL